jgi:hypothetical protein
MKKKNTTQKPKVGQLWRVATGERKGGYTLVRITEIVNSVPPVAYVRTHEQKRGHILLDYLMPASKEDVQNYLKK